MTRLPRQRQSTALLALGYTLQPSVATLTYRYMPFLNGTTLTSVVR